MPQTALITGATSGIGKAIGLKLAAQGHNVIINGFAESSTITDLHAEFMAAGAADVAFYQNDLTKLPDIESMITKIQDNFGMIHFLVNNAGIQHLDSCENFPVDKWDKIIALNLSAVFHTSRLVIPEMKQHGFGRIINIASTHGIVASPRKVAYIAAKHGVVGLTKCLGLELANTGVTANTICPGWVYTPLVAAQVEKMAQEQNLTFEEAKILLLSEKQPQHQFTLPEEIGDLVLFLVSPSAKNITGASYVIDGGWTAQ